jgi:hypothetical protein
MTAGPYRICLRVTVPAPQHVEPNDGQSHDVSLAVCACWSRARVRMVPPSRSLSAAQVVQPVAACSDNDSADVLVAVTEDGLRTEVKGGENKRRTLTHAAVARDLVTVGPALRDSASMRTTVRLEKDWRRDALKVLAFVQQRHSRHILAAAVRPLEIRR